MRDIVVPVGVKYKTLVEQLVDQHQLDKVKVVEGCQSRHRSIYAGVQAVNTGLWQYFILIMNFRLFSFPIKYQRSLMFLSMLQ